jgi:hypothetical protein
MIPDFATGSGNMLWGNAPQAITGNSFFISVTLAQCFPPLPMSPKLRADNTDILLITDAVL